jgi:hypothetical protein
MDAATDWDGLFPAGDFSFKLTLQRGRAEEFFAASDPTGAVARERADWVASAPERYLALRPEAVPVFEEWAETARGWDYAPAWSRAEGSPAARLAVMAAGCEADVLLLAPDAAGEFRLAGGALCFPTGWALEEKLGQTLEAIHGPVPGLNAALGPALRQFLARLRPGPAYLRQNWGIAASDERNLHPYRRIREPVTPVDLTRLWLRVERQALVALPRTRGIVFGIRIDLHRLDAVAAGPGRVGLRRHLASMPAELIGYKRLGAIRNDLIDRLS